MNAVRDELHRQAGYLHMLGRRKSSCQGDSLREIRASVDVSKEEKQGSETNVRVLEELKKKVVSLDAEVDAGRRGRDAWIFLSSVFSRTLTNLFLRANNNIAATGVNLIKKIEVDVCG